MKTRSRIIAVLSILLLCAGLFVACSADVADSAASEAGKTAYLNFGDYSKSISSTSIQQTYTIKPVSEVYWVYHAEKKDNAGTTGAMATDVYLPVKDAYADVVTELQGLNGTVGPFSVGKWQFTLLGYTDVTDAAPNEDYIAVNVMHGETAETLYYHGQIYSASSSVITLSESTADNPQAISVEVIFAGSGYGTVKVEPGYFYWVNDNGGDVEGDGEVLRMHLTFAPTSGVATEKYITLDAKDYDNSTAVKYRYEIADATEATFALAAGDYDTTFAIERWSTGETPSYISTLSGASGIIVKVYAKQTLVIDAQFLESSFGYVTFNGVTPAPVLVQRLVLDTAAELVDGKRVTSGTTPQTVSHDGLSVTYPVGTILTAETRSAIDGQTSDATTGFVYTGETPTGFVLQDDEANLGYELTVNVDQSNQTVLTIEKNVGAGRDVRAVYHNGNEMTAVALSENPVAETYNYNASTGLLTLYVQHASPIDVVYVPSVVTDTVASVTHGTTVTTFATLGEAVAAAVAGDTVTLFKDTNADVTVTNQMIIDLNNKNYGGTITVGTANNKYVKVINGTANVDAVSRYGSYYFPNLYIASSGTVYLLKDFSMGGVTVNYGNNYTIDLGGNTLTLTYGGSDGAFEIKSDIYDGVGHLTIKNGDLVFTSTSSSANAFEVYGTLVLDHVNIDSKCGNAAIKGEGGTWSHSCNITLTNCNITSEGYGIHASSYHTSSSDYISTVSITNSTITAKKTGLHSNGTTCTIVDSSISSNGTSSSDYGIDTKSGSPASGIASNVTISGNSSISAANAHAVNNTSGTVVINGNVTVTGSVYSGDFSPTVSITINGGSYTGPFSLGNYGRLYINGGSYDEVIISVTQGGSLTVTGIEEPFEGINTYTIDGSNGTYSVSDSI